MLIDQSLNCTYICCTQDIITWSIHCHKIMTLTLQMSIIICMFLTKPLDLLPILYASTGLNGFISHVT